MSKIKLLLINTIGLTGADLLLPKLATYEEIAVLPGQNCSIFNDNLYRVHDYTGWEVGDIFESLARNLYTKDGRMWMGLTKNMKTDERNNYSKELHKRFFTRNFNESTQFTSLLENYILSYFDACGQNNSKRIYASWFSNNVLLNSSSYKNFEEKVNVIHVSSSISRWLTYISQTRTWDCSKAIKFWLINNLYALIYSQNKKNILIIEIDELINDENNLFRKIEKFLSLDKTLRNESFQPGFIHMSKKIVDEQSKIAVQMDKIYQNYSLYNLASSFNEWSNAFIKQKNVKELFEQFTHFWNSTCHTNFDWIGPVGDEIIDKINDFNKVKNTKNFSFTFYHEYFELNSDHYDHVNRYLSHYLGCMEDELVIPPLPFFIRICIEYLVSASENGIKLGHSYTSFRNGKVYKTLKSEDFQNKIDKFGLRNNFQNLEKLIDEVERVSKQ